MIYLYLYLFLLWYIMMIIHLKKNLLIYLYLYYDYIIYYNIVMKFLYIYIHIMIIQFIYINGWVSGENLIRKPSIFPWPGARRCRQCSWRVTRRCWRRWWTTRPGHHLEDGDRRQEFMGFYSDLIVLMGKYGYLLGNYMKL